MCKQQISAVQTRPTTATTPHFNKNETTKKCNKKKRRNTTKTKSDAHVREQYKTHFKSKPQEKQSTRARKKKQNNLIKIIKRAQRITSENISILFEN